MQAEDYFNGSELRQTLSYTSADNIHQRDRYPSFFRAPDPVRPLSYQWGNGRGTGVRSGESSGRSYLGSTFPSDSALPGEVSFGQPTQAATNRNPFDQLRSSTGIRQPGDTRGLGYTSSSTEGERSGVSQVVRGGQPTGQLRLDSSTDTAAAEGESGMEAIAELSTGLAQGAGKGHGSGITNAGIVGGHAASAAITGAFGIGSEAIKSNTDKALQQNSIAWQQQKQASDQAQQLTMQTNTFNQEKQLSTQAYNQSIGLQTNATTQAENLYTFQTGTTANALTKAGLPSYLAYMPGAMSLQPHTTQAHGVYGYTSKLPGDPTTSPFTGSTTQSALGWGKFP